MALVFHARLRAAGPRGDPAAGCASVDGLRASSSRALRRRQSARTSRVRAREPGADPLRALEEGERRPARAPDGHAAHEPARVDEAHVVEQAPGRGDAGGDRAERRDRRDGLRHAAQAEGVGARRSAVGQRLDAGARMVRPENTVSSTTASDAQSATPASWAASSPASVLTSAVAAAAVLLAGEPDAADAREPAGARVERLRPRAARPRRCRAPARTGACAALGDHALDLLAEREDAHPLRVAGEQREQVARERGGGRARARRGAPPRRSDRRGRREAAGWAARTRRRPPRVTRGARAPGRSSSRGRRATARGRARRSASIASTPSRVNL